MIHTKSVSSRFANQTDVFPVKTLFWLPKMLPPNTHLIVFVAESDVVKVAELTKERDFAIINLSPLKGPDREELAMATLQVRGKALSSEQKVKIVSKAQTENPLFLKILLEELCSFGEFFQLDAYLDGLLQANNTKELFLKFLERLEQDYNPEEYDGNLIKDIMCCILVARQGLSETELKAILNISDQIWSVVFFAIEDFLLERSGLLGFSYDELITAVKEKYGKEQCTIKHYLMLEVQYFEGKLQEKNLEYTTEIPQRVKMELPWLLDKAGEKDQLIKCLTTPSLFWALRSGENDYDLIHYWNSTGIKGEEINSLYEKAVDDQLALLYLKEREIGRQPINALRMLHPLVYEIAQFQGDAGNMTAMEPFLNRAINLLKFAHSEEEIKHHPKIAETFCQMTNSLACMYVDVEEFAKAEPLHKEVLEVREKFADKWKDGWSSVATSLNGLGVLCYKTNKFDEALEYYNKCLELHRRSLPPTHHLIPDTLNNIAATYSSMGKWKECADVLEEALQLYEEAYFGQLPPDVGGTLLNLAMAYVRLDDTGSNRAESLYLRALDIRTKAYGPDHRDVGQTLLSYSAFLLRVDPKRSAEVAKQAAEIFEKSFGLEHTNTLSALENVALAFATSKEFAEAHPYFKKSGVVRHRKGQMNSSIPILNSVMADYYLNNGHHEEARQLFERLVRTDFVSDRDFAALDFLDHDLLGENRPERHYRETVDYGLEKFPSSVMLFGRKLPTLAEIGDYEGTLAILEKGNFGAEKYNESYQSFVDMQHRKEGLEIIVIAHATFPEDTVILHNLALCHAFYKDYEKACVYFKELLRLQPEDVAIGTNYGRMLALSGEVDKAIEQLTRTLKIVEDKNEETLIEQVNSYLKLLRETSPERH